MSWGPPAGRARRARCGRAGSPDWRSRRRRGWRSAARSDAIVTAPAHKHALQPGRVPVARTHRMAGPPGRGRGRRDDARGRPAPGGAGHDSRAAPRRARSCSPPTRWSGPAASPQTALHRLVGHRRAATRGLRAESARRRGGPVRRRGGAGAPARRWRRSAPAGPAGGHGLRAGDAGRVRRGARAVSRRGDDGDQGCRVRAGRERDAGPAVSADLARSRHRVRHRRHRAGRSGEHAAGARAGGGVGGAVRGSGRMHSAPIGSRPAHRGRAPTARSSLSINSQMRFQLELLAGAVGDQHRPHLQDRLPLRPARWLAACCRCRPGPRSSGPGRAAARPPPSRSP